MNISGFDLDTLYNEARDTITGPADGATDEDLTVLDLPEVYYRMTRAPSPQEANRAAVEILNRVNEHLNNLTEEATNDQLREWTLGKPGEIQYYALDSLLSRIQTALEPDEYAEWFESTEYPKGLTLDERNQWFALAVVAKSRTAL